MIIGIDWATSASKSRNYLTQAYGRAFRTTSILYEHLNEEGRRHCLTGPAFAYEEYNKKYYEHYIEGRYHTEVDFALHIAEKVTTKLCLELLPKITTKREYRVITCHLKKLGWNKKQRNRIPTLLDLTDLFKKKKAPSQIEKPIILRTSKSSAPTFFDISYIHQVAADAQAVARHFNCPVITAEQTPKQTYFTKEIDPTVAESQEK